MKLNSEQERDYFRHLRQVREANILILTDADRADVKLAADKSRRLAKLAEQARFNASHKRDREGRFA